MFDRSAGRVSGWPAPLEGVGDLDCSFSSLSRVLGLGLGLFCQSERCGKLANN